MRFRSLLVGSLLTTGLIGLHFLHAQEAATASAAPDSIVRLTAESGGLALIPPDEMPTDGNTFWIVTADGITAPYPFLPSYCQGAPAYTIASNATSDILLIDASGGLVDTQGLGVTTTADALVVLAGEVENVITQTQAAVASQQTRTMSAGTMQTMDDSGTFSPLFSYPAGSLWLQINGITNGTVYLTLNNTTNGVEYQILSQTALSNAPLSSWNAEGPLFWGSTTTNWTATTVAQNGRSNLFLSAQSQIDSTGTGIPDWWWLKYFGQDTNVNAYGDPAGDGWNNLEKFQLGMNPTNFYTPPTPQGLTAILNSGGNSATVSWEPSPIPVSGYTVEDSAGNTFNFSADTVGFDDTTSDFEPDPRNYGDIDTTLKIEAHYPGGNSAWSAPVSVEQNAIIGSLVAGPQGTAYVAASALPANTAAIRLKEIDFWPSPPVIITNYDVPISNFTNGLYPIPNNLVPSDGNYRGVRGYAWFAQAVGTNGIGLTAATYLSTDYTSPQDDFMNSWLVPPYFDGRAQLKQNLIFQLRAALAGQPFQYTEIWTNYYNEEYLVSSPTNYAYAGYWYFDSYYGEYRPDLDVFRPFEENYLERNFVFDSSELDANGRTTTGVGGDFASSGLTISGGVPSDVYSYFQLQAAYSFVAPTTNGAAIPSMLATNQTRWLSTYALDSSTLYLSEIGITKDSSQNPPTYDMFNNAYNWFGLKYLSAEIGYSGPSTTTLYAGGNTTQGGYFYPETAQPQFQIVGYDCWPVPSDAIFTNGTDFPGMAGLSLNHTNSVLITSVGNNSYQVACYAQLAVTNAYPGVYGFLEQYFDQAYQLDDNGNVTTNTTGILSPYGSYFATEPGEAALVTMPDVDTGERGTCTVYAVSLALDANHDGVMSTNFGGPDSTSQANPYVFWANNNFDRWDTIETPLYTETEEDDVPSGDPNSAGQDYDPNEPDCNYHNLSGDRVIPDTRDLEDFARLWVCGITPDLVSNLPPGSTITLSWGDIGNPNPNNPTIDVFQSVEGDGGIGYLTNETVATEQLGSSLYVGQIGPGVGIQKPAYMFENGYGLNHLIWCGASNGVGQLTMTIADGNGNTLAQASQWIQIVDIKQMYERWTVGDAPSQPPTTTPVPAADDLPTNVMQHPFLYSTNVVPGTPYILFVHGYNMPLYDKARYAETAFKRLYWQGYQGRFGSFQWPTAQNAVQFGGSELQAWDSAPGLLNLLTSLDAEYHSSNVYLMAHSLGNVVAGEALRLATNQVVNTYVAMQGAVTAHAYDPTTTPYTLTDDWGAPDVYAHYWTSNAPCYFNASAGAGTYVNFYNTNDWALNGVWLLFQNSKPVLDLNYSFTPPDYYFKNSGTTELFFPANTYEIFDEIIQSRSYALGMQPNVGGVFKTLTYNQVNLPNVWPPDPLNNNYKSHIWHSAEFRSDNPQRWLFWDQVLFQMGLKNSL